MLTISQLASIIMLLQAFGVSPSVVTQIQNEIPTIQTATQATTTEAVGVQANTSVVQSVPQGTGGQSGSSTNIQATQTTAVAPKATAVVPTKPAPIYASLYPDTPLAPTFTVGNSNFQMYCKLLTLPGSYYVIRPLDPTSTSTPWVYQNGGVECDPIGIPTSSEASTIVTDYISTNHMVPEPLCTGDFNMQRASYGNYIVEADAVGHIVCTDANDGE